MQDQALSRVVKKHLDPEPRLKLSKALMESGHVKTAIDLSDGLSTDLSHICKESSVGAIIDQEAIPISEETETVAGHLSCNPVNLAISGGEDFELLWIAPEAFKNQVIRVSSEAMGHPPHIIGKIVAGKGVMLKDGSNFRDINYKGYEHRA
jgi:thiamine-monophosphate kinase